MNLQDFHSNPEVTAAIEKAVKETLKQIGEDPAREGLLKTPHRVGEALQFLCKGYNEDPEAILRSALFEEDYRQMVVVKDIDFYSLCEHHMLPFFGKVHVAYIPDGRITGLSKIARVVDVYARRLQVQERLTTQIKDCIQNTLNPLGVMVVIEAEHLCMDAWCPETARHDRHFRLHRCLHPSGNEGRILETDQGVVTFLPEEYIPLLPSAHRAFPEHYNPGRKYCGNAFQHRSQYRLYTVNRQRLS